MSRRKTVIGRGSWEKYKKMKFRRLRVVQYAICRKVSRIGIEGEGEAGHFRSAADREDQHQKGESETMSRN